MSDDDRDWRAPDAKRMTFDEMAARAQYEWDRAEKAEAEAANYSARIEALEAENARLREAAKGSVVIVQTAITERKAAESALAEAVEVMRPFSDDLRNFRNPDEDNWLDGTPYVKRSGLKTSHLRAARAFVQQHEGKK